MPAMANPEFRCTVKLQYLPEQSQDGQHAFAYTITIVNSGDVAAQLVARHWVITDAHGHTEEVRGLAVVGKLDEWGVLKYGAINRQEIAHMEYLMRNQFRMNDRGRAQAIKIWKQTKDSVSPFDEYARAFYRDFGKERHHVMNMMDLLFAMAALGTVGIFLAGWFASRLGTPRPVVLGFAGISFSCMTTLALWSDIPTGALIAVLLVFGLFSNFFPAIIEHGRSLFDDRLRGRSLTSINVWVFVGVGITQPVSGFIMESYMPAGATAGALPEEAYRALFTYLAVLVLAGASAYALFARYRRS